ncbi:MAG: nucleotidyltransferase family protein [Myxococcota bacterium]
MQDDEPVAIPLGDTLDLHTFRPRDVGSLVPEWLTACREAGMLEVRVVHGKGTGALRAGVLALLERSPLVRALASDGNWGGVTVRLWDPREDEARVRAILAGSPRFRAALGALAAVGPPGAWLGAGAVRNRVWHVLHHLPGEPDDRDLDVAWHGAGDPDEDARWTARLREALDAPWEVVDQARHGAPSAEAGIARWPETATCVAARGDTLLAAYGWGDVVGMVVRPIPGLPADTWRARLATKQWRRRFPWVRIEPD